MIKISLVNSTSSSIRFQSINIKLYDCRIILTVCAIIAVIAFITIYFWLPETAGKNFVGVNSSVLRSIEKKNVKSYPSVGFTALPSGGKEDLFCIVGDEDDYDEDCFEVEGRMEEGNGGQTDLKSKSTSMDSTIINGHSSDNQTSQAHLKVSSYAMLSIVEEGEEEGDLGGAARKMNAEVIKKPQNFNEMLTSKSIRSMGVLYSCLCFSVMFVDESFPLWAVTSIQKRGLSWNSGQVGAVLASVGKRALHCMLLHDVQYRHITDISKHAIKLLDCTRPLRRTLFISPQVDAIMDTFCCFYRIIHSNESLRELKRPYMLVLHLY